MPRNEPCQQCKGNKYYQEKIRNGSHGFRGDSDYWVWAYVVCDMCLGKGYTDQEDHNRYLRGMGLEHLQTPIVSTA